MSEAGITTEDLSPVRRDGESRRAKLLGWLSRKVGLGPKPELKIESQQTMEAPLPVAGGETDSEPETQAVKGKWKPTDSAIRVARAEQAEPVRDAAGLTKKDKLSLLTGQGGPPNELESLNRNDELIALAAAGVARQKVESERPKKPTSSRQPVKSFVRRTA